MNQAELVKELASVASLTNKEAEGILKKLGEVVTQALVNGGEVTLPGLGKLTVKTSAARRGRNPATGAEMDIPAKTKPHFSAAKTLKDAVAG